MLIPFLEPRNTLPGAQDTFTSKSYTLLNHGKPPAPRICCNLSQAMSRLTSTPEPLCEPAQSQLPPNATLNSTLLQALSKCTIAINSTLRTWPILKHPLDLIRPRLIPHLGPDHPDYHIVPIRILTIEVGQFWTIAVVCWPFDFGQLPFLCVRTTLELLHRYLLSGKNIHFLLDIAIDAIAAPVALLVAYIQGWLRVTLLLKSCPLELRLFFLLGWKCVCYYSSQPPETGIGALALLAAWEAWRP